MILKRIYSYTQRVQFILVALVALSADSVLWMRLVPGSYGLALIQRYWDTIDRMKRRWFVGIVILLLVIAMFVVINRRSSTMDTASLLAAELEIRDALNEFTAAMKARDVERLADVISYPADIDGVLFSNRSGFISRMSHVFRMGNNEIYDLSYEISFIEIKPHIAVANMVQTAVMVGYSGQLEELEIPISMTFRKVGDDWKIADSGQSVSYDDSILGNVMESWLTIPTILLIILLTLGYFGWKIAF